MIHAPLTFGKIGSKGILHYPTFENQKPGFSLAKAFLVLQNAQKATIRLVQTTKNLVSMKPFLSTCWVVKKVCRLPIEVISGPEISSTLVGLVIYGRLIGVMIYAQPVGLIIGFKGPRRWRGGCGGLLRRASRQAREPLSRTVSLYPPLCHTHGMKITFS